MKYLDNIPVENVLLYATLLYLFCAIFLFGFAVSANKLGVKGEKTFTVSDSLEYGKTPYIVTCLLISFFFICTLLLLKNEDFIWHRILLLLLIYIFFILICWFTPTKNSNLHNIFTGFIIVSSVIFLTITYYNLYAGSLKHIIKILSTILLIIIIGMFITGLNSREKGDAWTDTFAVFEILLILLFGVSLILFAVN